jgi:hypothetical protein
MDLTKSFMGSTVEVTILVWPVLPILAADGFPFPLMTLLLLLLWRWWPPPEVAAAVVDLDEVVSWTGTNGIKLFMTVI